MKDYLPIFTIGYDSQTISKEVVNFFTDEGDKEEPSAREINEDIIIKWLFDKQITFRQILYCLLGITQDYTSYFSQTEPFVVQNKKPGDIDIILHSKKSDKKAIAVECKRVKALINEDGKESINKLGNLYSGVLQANALFSLGFHQTYYVIIIITDGRSKKQNNMGTRGLTRKSFDKILAFEGREKLNDNIGLILIEVTQNTGRSIDLSGCINIHLHKSANSREQFVSVTDKLNNIN